MEVEAIRVKISFISLQLNSRLIFHDSKSPNKFRAFFEIIFFFFLYEKNVRISLKTAIQNRIQINPNLDVWKGKRNRIVFNSSLKKKKKKKQQQFFLKSVATQQRDDLEDCSKSFLSRKSWIKRKEAGKQTKTKKRIEFQIAFNKSIKIMKSFSAIKLKIQQDESDLTKTKCFFD